MGKYIATRVALAIFVLLMIASIMFFMFRLMPGDPTMFFLQEGASPQVIEHQRELWGLNDPLWIQYLRYLKNLFTFDFGISFRQATPVRPIILEKLLNTFSLMFPSFTLIVVFSLTGGAILGWKRGSKVEQGALLCTLLFRSMPSFFFAILLLMIFSYKLGWLPSGGMREPGTNLPFLQTVLSHDFLAHLILPVAALVLRDTTGPMLVMRTSVLETVGEDFIDVMRAEGLPEWRIIWHVGRNAMLPVITYLAVLVGFFFQGQVLLETVFSWPGIGREIVNALNLYDFPIAQAAFFLSAVVIVGMNLTVDILYGFLDPRIRYD